MGGAVDPVRRTPGAPSDNGHVQGQHGMPGAGSLQASVELGDCGTRTGNKRVPDPGRIWREKRQVWSEEPRRTSGRFE
ncbi:hypothetical protein D3C72_2148710 [compost metagenome]